MTPRGRQAVQVIGHARAFGGDAPTRGGRAARALAETHPAQALVVVRDHGTLPGQLMALSGLHNADHAAFVERVDRYKTVTTQSR